MDVSIILVSYNTRALSLATLESVYRHTEGIQFEIFLVDNASSDGSAEAIEAAFPEVRVIRSRENLGFGRANNLAIPLARGRYLFFLNTDTLLLNNALALLVARMDADTEGRIGALGGALFNPDGSAQISFGRFPWLGRMLAEQWLSGLMPKAWLDARAMAGYAGEQEVEVDYITGADLLVRREAVGASGGGFDPDFFLYFEESEWCYRLWKAGYRCVVYPAARIVHLCGGSTGPSSPHIFEHSRLLFYRKTRGRMYAELCRLAMLLYACKLMLKPSSRKYGRELTKCLLLFYQ